MRAILSDYGFAVVNANYLRLKSGKGLRVPRIRDPERFSDKLLYLKLHRRVEGASRLVDKFRVRDYIRSKGLEGILVPLVGVYESPSEISASDFPAAFVIKPNHASGKILFCQRSDFSLRQVQPVLQCWLDTDYSSLGVSINTRISSERLLWSSTSDLLA